MVRKWHICKPCYEKMEKELMWTPKWVSDFYG
jgi:hypothetical protein